MSKTYKTVTRPAKTEEVVDKTTCDLCGKEIEEGRWFDIDEVEVSYRSGVNYGNDGGNSETVKFDICHDCFTGTLVPFLESKGAVATTEESDW